jgi:hypothetical protein
MLSGSVLNNDTSILFHAQLQSGQFGVFQVPMTYNGESKPTIDGGVPLLLIKQGDLLGSSVVVGDIGSAALSNGGFFSTCAVVITVPSENGSPLAPQLNGTPMLWHNGSGQFEAIVKHNDETPTGGRFGAKMGDVAINASNDILLVADYHDEQPNGYSDLAQGLFLLDGGTSSSQGSLVQRTGGETPGANGGGINQIGICDLDDDGGVVFQAFSRGGVGATGAAAPVQSCVMGARAGRRPALIAGSLSGGGSNGGNVYLGPRIHKNDHTQVVHTDPAATQQTLFFNNRPVLSTGAHSPLGKMVNGVGPGSVTNGLTHFVVTVEDGMELIVSNGDTQKTILKYGDKIANSTNQIRGIVHGYHSDQADNFGRIVFIGEFEDGSQSVVVGIPI